MAAVLAEMTSDVLIVTEGSAALLPADGYSVDAGSEWGYGPNEHRRKVLLWSRHPWSEGTALEVGAGRGRVVSAVTNSPLGEILVVGVCIPWAAAHVTTGRRDARRWDEHIDCCSQLQEFSLHPRSIMAGDFNQTIPRISQPIRAADALGAVLTNWDRGNGWTAVVWAADRSHRDERGSNQLRGYVLAGERRRGCTKRSRWCVVHHLGSEQLAIGHLARRVALRAGRVLKSRPDRGVLFA